MGNDGGSIARRDELVKVKVSTLNSKSRAKSTQKQRWTTCTLSKEPLREPVVADALGRMYNKEAVAEWLIERAMKKAQGKEVPDAAKMSHVKGFKVRGVAWQGKRRHRVHTKFFFATTILTQDLTTLKLTPNPSYKSSNEDTSSSDDTLPLNQTPFLCPLSSRPMNGTARFVYIRTDQSGAVLSESALKATVSSSSMCPVTETNFNPGSLVGKNGAACVDVENVGDVILINPVPGSEEEKVLNEAMKKGKKNAKEKRKRSAAESGDGGDGKKVKAEDGGGHVQGRKSTASQEDDKTESRGSNTNDSLSIAKSNGSDTSKGHIQTVAKTAKA